MYPSSQYNYEEREQLKKLSNSFFFVDIGNRPKLLSSRIRIWQVQDNFKRGVCLLEAASPAREASRFTSPAAFDSNFTVKRAIFDSAITRRCVIAIGRANRFNEHRLLTDHHYTHLCLFFFISSLLVFDTRLKFLDSSRESSEINLREVVYGESFVHRLIHGPG